MSINTDFKLLWGAFEQSRFLKEGLSLFLFHQQSLKLGKLIIHTMCSKKNKYLFHFVKNAQKVKDNVACGRVSNFQ